MTAKAQYLTGVAVRALLDRKSPTHALLDYRRSNAAWTADLANAPTVVTALFPRNTDDD